MKVNIAHVFICDRDEAVLIMSGKNLENCPECGQSLNPTGQIETIEQEKE